MLIIAGLILLALAVQQRRIIGYVLYPPTVLCVVWGAALVWLSLTGSRFNEVSPATILIYVAGTLSFCLGGVVGWRFGHSRNPTAKPDPIRAPSWLVPSLTGIVLLLTPLFVARVLDVVGGFNSLQFLYDLRVDWIENGGIGLVGNLVPFATMCAYLAAMLPAKDRLGRISRAVLFLNTLVLCLLTAAIGSALQFLLGVGAIAGLRSRTIPLKGLGVAAPAFLFVFAILSIYVRKGNASPESTWRENATAIVDNLELYSLGGVVAFDRMVENPLSVPSNLGYLRTLRDMENKLLGMEYDLPEKHMEYTNIGEGMDSNVYTMYGGYYPEEGLLGTLCLTMFAGLFCTVAFRRALAGKLVATFYFASLTSSVLQTTFGEPIYTDINFLSKMAIFSFLLAWILKRRQPVLEHQRAV